MVTYLATIAEVRAFAELTNEYSDAIIESYINIAENNIFSNYSPIKKYSEITIDNNYGKQYYLYDKDSRVLPYSITAFRKQVSTTVEASGWQTASTTGVTIGYEQPTIELDPNTTYVDADVYRIDWIPMHFHILVMNEVKLTMYEDGILLAGESSGANVTLLEREVESIKNQLKPRGFITATEQYANYSPSDYVGFDRHESE